MRLKARLFSYLGGFSWVLVWAAPARALTLTVEEHASSQVGVPATFRVAVADAVGPVLVRWDFGDATPAEFVLDALQSTHAYATANHYPVLVAVRDDTGTTGDSFVHTVHEPLTNGRANGSSDLVYDAAAGRVYTANLENDSISIIDAVGLTKLGEVPLSRGPVSLAVAPQGRLWVLSRDAAAISIVNTASAAVEQTLMLPYASQPMGLAISPRGDAAYVSLMALGKLLKLDVATAAVVAEVDVGSSARGVSVSYDGSQVYVTRFISEGKQGEVVRLDAAPFQISARIALSQDETTMDTDAQGRGLPNYLFSIALSPDGLWAWVPGKKDNIFRGLLRDSTALSDDNTVRPLVALLNVADGVERFERRIDLDDRNLPTQVEFTPLGDYAFVSVTGSALVEVRDAYTGNFVTALRETGFAPRGLALSSDQRLFVHAPLSRKVAVYDAAGLVASHSQTAEKLADIATVSADKLDPQVLRGKQLFFNSADVRMSDQGYISCASCHFDGADDGRVWDFASVGEGLRNTVSLLGRRGTAQGNVNWSGSFDEVQDADDNIRNLFGGKGFLSAEQLAVGSVGTALGDKKAGLSPELDALAAFVKSLDSYHPSPFRNPDGSLTPDGEAGRVTFQRLGCDFCHTGGEATDSARGRLHDVGTIQLTSGQRSGQPLFGLDTPTLNGVWETAPYLHDGSAATLRDVLVTKNPQDTHAYISVLSEQQLGELISYVRQLDGSVESVETGGAGMGGGGTSGSGGGGTSATSGAGLAGAQVVSPSGDGGCAVAGLKPATPTTLLLLAGLFGTQRLRRRRYS